MELFPKAVVIRDKKANTSLPTALRMHKRVYMSDGLLHVHVGVCEYVFMLCVIHETAPAEMHSIN